MTYPRDQEFILRRGSGSFTGYITGEWESLDGTILIYIEDGRGAFAIGRKDRVIPVKLPPQLNYSHK